MGVLGGEAVTGRRDGRVVIVGHGPSIYSGLGSLIDACIVVRLKRGLVETYDTAHWGSRTDYLCARSPRFDHGHFPFWLSDVVAGPTGKKPTTGFCAVLEAKKRLNPTEIFVIGFDRLMWPWQPDSATAWLAHDKWAEHEALKKLGVKELG